MAWLLTLLLQLFDVPLDVAHLLRQHLRLGSERLKLLLWAGRRG